MRLRLKLDLLGGLEIGVEILQPRRCNVFVNGVRECKKVSGFFVGWRVEFKLFGRLWNKA